MGGRDAFDQSVETEATQVVAHPAWAESFGFDAQEWGDVVAQVAVAEPVGSEPIDSDGGQQGMDPRVTEAQGGDSLASDDGRGGNATKTASPIVGSWSMRSASRRRRLAEKPTFRKAGRLHSRLPMPKSRLSLIVVSVRIARFFVVLFTLVDLYST